MINIRAAIAAILACAVLSPAQSGAQTTTRTFTNPLIDAFGGPLAVESIEVRYPAEAFAAALDRPSARYVEERFSDQQREAFAAFATPRGATPDAMGERFSEYLSETDLRGRFSAPAVGSPSLRLSIIVDEVHFRGMIASAFAPGFPSTDMSFTLSHPDTNAVFASGRIRRCASWAANINAARDKHDLHFNWSGTDTNFRMMTGLTDALANCVQQLLVAPRFPEGPTQVSTVHTGAPFFLSVPINVGEPIYEITMADGQ